MSDTDRLNNILSFTALQAKNLFYDKLKSVVLFGSYARGDYDEESDIDIMILADIDVSEAGDYTRLLRDRIYGLELEYDCVLSLCVVSEENYNKFKDILPFYRNVAREGVRIAV